MIIRLFQNYNIFFPMTKKAAKRQLRMNRSQYEAQIITPKELKAFAAKKVRQLQMSKTKCPKISKTSTEKIERPKRKNPIQKEMFQEIIQQSEFQCPVCLELMIEPTLLQCGHAYCFKCIEELMIYKSNCGVCRNIQKDAVFQRSKYLESLIEKVVLRKSEHFLDFYCRLADVQNWKRVRNVQITELNKGSFIDFRDKELKWRKAQITRINLDETKGNYQIQVKYKKDGQNVVETFNSDSGRYAKFSYYTRMKYLEPRNHIQGLLAPSNQQPLLTPIPSSFVEIEEEIRAFQRESAQDSAELPLMQNMDMGDSTVFPYIEEDEFLNEIFESNQGRTQEIIEILG